MASRTKRRSAGSGAAPTPLIRVAAAALFALLALDATAAEFRSVSSTAAVLYDSPSDKGKKLFIAPRGMPVEIITSLNQWIKVRDVSGDVMWIQRDDLAAARTLVATTLVSVRQAPSETAPLLLQAERGVVLELLETAAGGWVKVRHRDGVVGFVRAIDVWGV